jgi:phage-related protein
MSRRDKQLAWLVDEIETPPFSSEARVEAGVLLRQLQAGERLRFPQIRSMPTIGKRCWELRVNDRDTTWRIVVRIDKDAIIVGEVFSKKSRQTPQYVIENARRRFRQYDA